MLTGLAKKITSFFIAQNLLNYDHYDWYVYTIEKRLVSFIGLLFLTIIGTVLSDFYSTIVFISGFYILRKYAGGYHTKSFLSCLILSVGTLLVNIYFITPILITRPPWAPIIVALISAVVLLALGTVAVPNLKMNNNEIIHHEKRLKIITLFQLSLVLFLVLFQSTLIYGTTLSVGLCVVALSSIIGKQKYRKEVKYEKSST